MTRREYVPAHILERLSIKLEFHRYYELFRRQPYSFLLDSASDPQKLGRYSILGANPFMVYKAKRIRGDGPGPHGARVEILERFGEEKPTAVHYDVADPFDDVRNLIAAHHVERRDYSGRPVPFLAGAIGYLGYEAGYFVEDLPDTGADDLGLPDIYLMFVNSALVHCHRTGATYLSVLGRGPNDRLAHARAAHTRDRVLAALERFEKSHPPAWDQSRPSARGNVPVTAQFDEAGYSKLIEQAKEHIFAGDIFEICLTHRMQARTAADPWNLYQELRRINPAPFSCFLDLPEATVVSSSPERFVRLGADRIAESRPIKGTRPRGDTEEADQAAIADLTSSEKDQAENNMIVDLVRNDFGRVCRFGTVNVPELRIIERYATVYQMVSTIRGQLNEDRDAIDLLRACFPGGSMTGAPKVEAMKLIDKLEPVKRNIYSGAIGYMDFSGPIDFNIVIRTIMLQKGLASFSVGGAIVADSIPKAEYQETLDKAAALIRALGNVAAE